jgi:hypothetical protein
MRLSEGPYQIMKLMAKKRSKRAPEDAREAGEAVNENRAPLMLEIKKDVPMPTAKRDTGELHNTLLKMEVGDCLDLPFPRFQRSNVASIAKRAGIKIMTRFIVLKPEESFGQIDTLRVWRAK